MMKSHLSLIAALGLVFTGCASDDSPAPRAGNIVVPPPEVKPLPPCESTLPFEIAWTTNEAAVFGYRVEVAVRGYSAFVTADLGGGARSYSGVLPMRGLDLQMRVTEFKKDNTSETLYQQLHVPTCATREDFQKQDPSYSEPLAVSFSF